jgi:hypothetical protein
MLTFVLAEISIEVSPANTLSIDTDTSVKAFPRAFFNIIARHQEVSALMDLASFSQIPLKLQSALVTSKVFGETEFFSLISDLSATRKRAKFICTSISRL